MKEILETLQFLPDYVGVIVMGQGQIHIAGVFPTGTYACPIGCTVSITKDVTFTDPETGKTYTRTNDIYFVIQLLG